MPNISYDEESAIISIRFSKKKSVDSDIQDNVVIDFDKDGNVVNIDVMNIAMKDFKRLEPVYSFGTQNKKQLK